MDKNLPQDPFEAFLQDHLQDHSEIPTDDPWEDIELALAIEQTNRDAKIWTWIVLGFFCLVLLTTGLIWVLHTPSNTIQKPAAVSSIVKTPPSQSLETTVEKTFPNPMGDQSEMEEAPSPTSSPIENKIDQTNPSTIDQATFSPSSSSQKQAIKSDNPASLILNRSKASDTQRQTPNTQLPPADPSSLPSQTIKNSRQFPTKPKETPEIKTPKKTEKEWIIAAKDQETSNPKTVSTPTAAEIAKEASPLTTNQSVQTASFTTISPLSLKEMLLLETERSQPTPEAVSLVSPNPIETPAQKAFFVESFFSLASTQYTFVRDQLPSNLLVARNNARTTTGSSWQTGVHLGLEWGSKVALYSGLYYTQRTFDTRRLGRQLFRQFRPDLSNDDEGQFTYEYSTATPTGVTDIQLRTEQVDPNDMIQANEVLLFETILRTDISQWSIPLGIRLQTAPDRWRFGGSIGIEAHFLTSSSLTLTNIRSLNQRLRILPNDRPLSRRPNLENFTMDVVAQARVQFQPWRKAYVYAEPSIARSLRSLNQSPLVSVSALSLGGRVGVGMRF